MRGHALLLICTLIPSIFAKCDEEGAEALFRRPVYEFSIDLLGRAAQELENHFVTSTLSAWTLLATTSLGAADTTLKEMKKVLGLHSLPCYNYKFLQLANSVVSNNSDVVVERSSSIFADDKMELSNEFKEKITKIGTSKIESMSFENPELAALTINDYTRRATHDTIDEIVSPADFENALIIMIDAVYFKGGWQIPFPYSETRIAPFYNELGDQISDVNLMYIADASFNMRYIPHIKAKVLELPYGEGGRYSMLVILPNDGVLLDTVIQKLKSHKINLKTIFKMFEEYGELSTSVHIPRFKITTDLSNLKELLIDMGLRSMFDSSQASFPLLSDNSLYVSSFIQMSDIEVTEEGTVASSATKAEFGLRTIPDEFIANKPFLFMIIDKKVMVPIFAGAYSKPSVY